VTGQRKTVKIFGAIELWKARFHYRQETVFNASTYFAFLEQLARSYRQQGAMLIQDNVPMSEFQYYEFRALDRSL
jgi:hypothetical protein